MRLEILILSVLVIAVLVSSGCVNDVKTPQQNDTTENDLEYFKTLCHTFTSFNYDSEKQIIWSTEPVEERLNSQVSWKLDMQWNMYSQYYYADCCKGSGEGENLNYYYCPKIGKLTATQTIVDSEGYIQLVDSKGVIIIIIPEEVTGETWKTETKCL